MSARPPIQDPLPDDTNRPVTLDQLLSRLSGVQKAGSGWKSKCPGHDDKNPSLSIHLGDDGKILLHCFAGCSTESVMTVIGLPMSLLAGSTDSAAWTQSKGKKATRGWSTPELAAAFVAKSIGSVEAIHRYHGLDGSCTFAVVRIRTAEDKTFRPLNLKAGRWHVGDPDHLLLLYRLREILTQPTVVVVEGEKCADQAGELGIPATTSAHGAKSAKSTDWTRLRNKKVVIWPDADEAGSSYAKDVASILRTIDPDAKIALLQLPGLPEGGDIVDFVADLRANGHPDEQIKTKIQQLIESAPDWPAVDRGDSAECADSAPGGATQKWQAPRPIAEQVMLPKFPIDEAFPSYLGRLKDFVVAVSECYQVPVDAAALLVLPIMALGLSKRFEVEPFPGWREQLSLYVLVLLPSGERKSAVLKVLLEPIYAWQREIASGMADDLLHFENKEQVLRERLDRARKKAAKNQEIDDGIDDLSQELADIENKKPRPPSLVVTDGTTEAIARSLVLNFERTLLASAEGDALDIMLGRYSGTPNFGVWLSGHAGDAIDSVRRGREADRLEKPALQVALCVQPGAVLDLIGSQAAQERGVVPRFFLSLPESKVGFRELQSEPIPAHLIDYYGTRIQSHLGFAVPKEPELIRVCPGALAVLNEFRSKNEAALRPDGDLAIMRAWGSKLPGAIVRVAGVLRGFEPDGPLEIDVETMRCALSLVPYLTEHYMHVGDLGGNQLTINLAQRIDHWYRRRGLKKFTRRDAFNQVKNLVEKVDGIDPALELLEERHRIAKAPSKPPDGPGRPPSPGFLVNPELISRTEPQEQKEHNPQNPPEEGAR